MKRSLYETDLINRKTGEYKQTGMLVASLTEMTA